MVTTAATPSAGGYTIGYDTDGIIKQKDSLGIVTPLFSSSSQNLKQTLNLGNDTGIYSIMMGTATSIYSANSTNRIKLGDNGSVIIYSVNTVTATSSIQISNDVINIFNSTASSSGLVQVSSNTYSVQVGSLTQSVALKQSKTNFELNHINKNATDSTVKVFEFGSSYDNDTISNKAYVHINSKSATTLSGVKNSVIIGGSSLTASVSNTVYLGNYVNINNEYTLPNTDGVADQYMKTDGFGNVVWDNFVPTTPSLSQVLSVDNNSATYSIIMGTSTSISSINGSASIFLDTLGVSENILLSTDGILKSKAYLDMNSDLITISATSGTITIGDKTGLQYSENYSSTFVNNSLVTKQYVDAQLSSVYVVNKISYVDPINGSDTTGLVNRIDKPYATVGAATFGLTSSGTFTIQQPGLIHLKKGQYSSNIYMENNIDYYCEPDVIFTANGFTDVNGAVTSNIYGFAKFIAPNTSNLVPLDVTKSSTINFQFLVIDNQSVAFKINNISGTSNVNITGNSISCRSSFGSGILIGDNSGVSNVNSNVKINIKEKIIGGYNTLNVKPLFNGNVEVNCPNIECDSDLASTGSQPGIQHAVIVQSASASVSINGNIIESSSIYGGGNNSALYVNSGTVSISGNITGGKCPSVLIENGSNGSVLVNGDMVSERESIINTSNSIVFTANNSLIKTDGLGTVAYPIHINSGSSSSTYLHNVRMYNTALDSGIILLSSTSSTIGIYNSIAYSKGNLGNFIYSSSTASVGIHNTRCNKDNSSTIIDNFSPSGFTYDLNLYLGNF
jgi:hypothetical protein